MSANMAHRPESPSTTFLAGNYEFTRLQARQCALLHQSGYTIWQIKEHHHTHATLKEIVVAIQVSIMWEFSIEELTPHIFDPNIVCLEVWRVGEPTQNN